jgi:hypothetical protein
MVRSGIRATESSFFSCRNKRLICSAFSRRTTHFLCFLRPSSLHRHAETNIWDDLRMDLGEVGWGDVDWTGLAQERNRWRALVNSVLNLRVPWNAGKLSSGLTTGGLSSSTQLHRVILPRYNDLTFYFKFWLKFLVTCTYSLFGMYCSARFIFKWKGKQFCRVCIPTGLFLFSQLSNVLQHSSVAR